MCQDADRRPKPSRPARHRSWGVAVAAATLLVAAGFWPSPNQFAVAADEPAPALRYGFKPGEQYLYSIQLEIKMPGLTELVKGTSNYGVADINNDVIRLRHRGSLSVQADASEGTAKKTTHSHKVLPLTEIRIDSFGKVLQTKGGGAQLPFLLGNLSTLALEPLSADGKSDWENKTECVIMQKQSVLSAPSRLRPIARPSKTETTIDFPATEVTTYSLGKPDGDKVVLHKKYELKTKDEQDGKPVLQMTGEGDITFSLKAGVPKSMEFKGVLKGAGLKNEVPITASFHLLEGEELEKALKEAAKQPAETAGADLKALGDDALTKALADLKSSDKERCKAAAKLLANAKPEGQRAEIAKALLTLAVDPDIFTNGPAKDALKVWAAKEDIPTLAKISSNGNIFIRQGALQILSQFQEEAAAEAIADRLTDIFDRGPASAALQKMGPLAEKVVWPYLKTGDAATKVEVCKILGVVGTSESKAVLEKAAANTNKDVAAAAKNALDAVAKR